MRRSNHLLNTESTVSSNSSNRIYRPAVYPVLSPELVFVVDSRERRPYRLEPSRVQALATGDYSVAGLEDRIAIERKEIDDLIGCLTRDRERFTRELDRGAAMDYFALVVEASLEDLAAGRYKSQMSVKSAVQSILAMSIKFRMPVWFVHNRAHGRRVTESILTKFHRWVTTPEGDGGLSMEIALTS